MTATTGNPVDVILAATLLAPAILVGVAAACGWVRERQPCDCDHCQTKANR